LDARYTVQISFFQPLFSSHVGEGEKFSVNLYDGSCVEKFDRFLGEKNWWHMYSLSP
jgi:hypothetical protein